MKPMIRKKEDLTTGPILQKLLRFAFPLLLGTLVQQLYNTVDLIFDGAAQSQHPNGRRGLSHYMGLDGLGYEYLLRCGIQKSRQEKERKRGLKRIP